jgi:oligosaccharyl transferase (archaeosortase A-associated)
MTKNKKKREEKSVRAEKNKEQKLEQKLNIPSYFGYIAGIILLAIFVLSLYLRIVMPYDSVFRNGYVAFASDDAVFQMRLVENTLNNFPHRIFYDAFTVYPTGSAIHWGPLWTQMIATISLIAGLGSYNMQTVNAIAAYFPGVLGALVVFPVYFIGKMLYNRSVGLLAAFVIAILPGQFFSRSMLGFTDHHVAEVLFSTVAMALFMLAIKAGRERNIKLSGLHLKDILKEKPVLYSIFAGIMLAAFHITWPGALFFIMIFLIFILVQSIADHLRGRSTDYIVAVAVPMFLVDLIAVLPYVNFDYGFGIANYSWFHVAVPIAGMMVPIALNILSKEINKRGHNPLYYPLSLVAFFAAVLLGVGIILPNLFTSLMEAPGLVFAVHTGGGNTVQEGTSIFSEAGRVWGNFPVTGFLQTDTWVLVFIFAALAYTGYRVARRQKPEEMLLLVWNIVMLLAIYGQVRWAYYFAVNIALMIGYVAVALSGQIIKFGGWYENPGKNIGLSHVLSAILVAVVVLFFVYPSLVITAIGTATSAPQSRYGGSDPSGGGYDQWMEALNWMRNNTPDPGLDYSATYEQPKNGMYPYPDSAYGVMSWWDYGHTITYWAHRIPNANPFQAGIGGGEAHTPGASTFLTAKSEEEANKVLDALGINGKPGARYIVSNGYMAYRIMDIFGIWNEDGGYRVQIQTSQGPQVVPSSKYYDNMEAKLHIFDGNGLKNYRLVHESPTNPNTIGGYAEQQYKYIYNILYGGHIPVEDSGLVKIFEYVKGAKIEGHAPPNTTVTLTNTIKTNIGRTIQYSQTTSSNGTYEFTVPYSTLDPIPGETLFDTKPTGPYTVTAGNISKPVNIKEEDILNGGTVTLDLI